MSISKQTPLEILATKLVKNQLKYDLLTHKQSLIIEHSDAVQAANRRKVIAIVGAGASRDAGLPLGSEAIQLLRKEMFENRNWDQRIYRAKLNELRQVSRLRGEEFETIMLALSEESGRAKEVRDFLANLYSLKFQPLYSNEILAHLFKHRFIDAIINFNFDELLDQSIADELRGGEYTYVLSDGDCPNPRADGTFELPLYIKPHGTVSHKSTLRFTRRDYFGIPMDIRDLLETLLSGPNVTLMVIGFNMQSFEFNEIVGNMQTLPEIFYVNHNHPEADIVFANEVGGQKRLKEYLIKVERKENGLSRTLDELWVKTSNIFKDKEPRNTARHRFISDLFHSRDSSPTPLRSQIENDGLARYLHDRTLIEIAFATAKGKGLLNISVLRNDRCGNYYQLYRRSEPRQQTLFEMCRNLGLKRVGYSRDAMRLSLHPGPKEFSKEQLGILRPPEFQAVVREFASRVVLHLQSDVATNNINRCFDHFCEVLQLLYEAKEIEMNIMEEKDYLQIYQNPRVIYTETGFHILTEKLLSDYEWDTLLISAETGEWLTKHQKVIELIKESQRPGILNFIIADTAHVGELQKTYGEQIGEIRDLPWWEHNKHMTILTKDREPIICIYFTRRLRSPYVTPVLLKDADCRLVLQYFMAYWKKAKEETSVWYGSDQDQEIFFKEIEEKQNVHQKKK